MSEKNILIIESECEIIRPIIKKRFKKQNILSKDDINKRIICDSSSIKKKDLFRNLNKSMEKNTPNEKNNILMNCKKSKAEYSIIEILNILSQPITNESQKNRYILQKDLSKLSDIHENDYNVFIQKHKGLYDLSLFNDEKNEKSLFSL